MYVLKKIEREEKNYIYNDENNFVTITKQKLYLFDKLYPNFELNIKKKKKLNILKNKKKLLLFINITLL